MFLREKSAADLALVQKQAEIAKKAEEHLKEETSRELSLKRKMTEMGTLKHSKQLEFYMQHKQIEFNKFLERAKIYRDTAVILKVLENA